MCNDCTVVVDGTCTKVFMQNCSNVNLTLNGKVRTGGMRRHEAVLELRARARCRFGVLPRRPGSLTAPVPA